VEKGRLRYALIIAICFIGGFILLPNLGGPSFWQDEAETALLARSINNHGYPSAWDGRNLITQLSGNDSGPSHIWSFTPWLPFYIVAGSFRLLGETNFAGRLPFVIFGILALFTLYLFVYKTSRDILLAALSSLLLLLNMQFILHTRQCKYYSLLFFVPPLLYLAYTKIHKHVVYFILFTTCIIVLFYTNYLSMFLAIAGITIHTFAVRRYKKDVLLFVLAGIISLAFTIPFFFVGDITVTSNLISRFPTPVEYIDKLARHIWYFNNMVFGLILCVPLLLFAKKGYFNQYEMRLLKLLLWIIFPAWLFLPLFNQDVFRYNLHLIPAFAALTALLVVGFFRWSRKAGVVFLLLILMTNISSNLPGIIVNIAIKASGIKLEEKTDWFVKKFKKDERKTRMWLGSFDKELKMLTLRRILTHQVLKAEYAAYVNELRGRYEDAAMSTVNFLREHAKDGDIVYINFDQLVLQFYLPNLTYGYKILPQNLFISKKSPLPPYITSLEGTRWYIFRDVEMNLSPYLTDEDFKAQFKGRLTPYELGVNALYWDLTWPQRYHQYINKMLWKDETGYNNVTVYRID